MLTTSLSPRKTPRQLLLGALVLASWCAVAAEPEPFVSSKTKQASTTIQAISQSDRHLVLLGEDGQRLVVEAGPAIKNFDQVRPGDHVVVTYYDGLIAEVKPKGAGTQGVQGATTTAQTPAGEMPAGAVGHAIATTVRVEAVDPASSTVTFKRPDGVTRKLAAEEPDAKRFIGKLMSGDEVQITYREATAVSIEPARG